jgi:2,3-bisphosphoglycerate-dependent phosphoglycerate mutase
MPANNLLILLMVALGFSACHPYKMIEHQDKLVRRITAEKVTFNDGTEQALPFAGEERATHMIMVRHAEKAFGNDPVLQPEGRMRAILLSEILSDFPLEVIYATKFIRTQQTARPTARMKGLEVNIYDLNQPTAFVNKVKRKYKGKHLLISGHSDTTPDLVNRFIKDKKDVVERIDERDYDNLFILSFNENMEFELLKLRYQLEKEIMD